VLNYAARILVGYVSDTDTRRIRHGYISCEYLENKKKNRILGPVRIWPSKASMGYVFGPFNK